MSTRPILNKLQEKYLRANYDHTTLVDMAAFLHTTEYHVKMLCRERNLIKPVLASSRKSAMTGGKTAKELLHEFVMDRKEPFKNSEFIEWAKGKRSKKTLANTVSKKPCVTITTWAAQVDVASLEKIGKLSVRHIYNLTEATL